MSTPAGLNAQAFFVELRGLQVKDYEPIDLDTYCNVGADFAGANVDFPIGPQTLHGLPFKVGRSESDRKCCFIGLGGGEACDSVTVQVGSKARHIVFAHALVDSQVLSGESPGAIVANYTFNYEQGRNRVRVPIRERFEIAIAPTPWGQLPFLARPDISDHLMPRHEGRWDQFGFRLENLEQGEAKAYYLWAWANPNPDLKVETVTLEPTDRRCIIAGITVGRRDEDPLYTRQRRVVLVRAREALTELRSGNLEVEVDRGVASYPYSLSETSTDEFLSREFVGWGEPQNTNTLPSYARVAAIPSATVVLKDETRELGRVIWGDLEAKGLVETSTISVELVDKGKNWVHVTVLDDDTGKPVPCRVHFRSPEGIPYQPHGHHDHVNSNLAGWHVDVGGDVRLGQITYAYIDGRCQGWLPRGDVIVDAARGFEYTPLSKKVRIERGQRELTLRLKRWTDMNSKGWFSGDSHVHFLGTQGAHLEGKGEDLNVVNLLQAQWGHLFTNSEDFTGKPSVSGDGRTIVYCSQENRQHLLGHLVLWGLRNPVMPWSSDGPEESEMGADLETTMSHWADTARAQGGTVVLAHLPNPNGEPAALIATGRADAVEMLEQQEYSQSEYYRYLNAGYQLPLVGGTDKMSSEVPVGLYRTYARLPEDQPFTYDNWCRAVREGRTFLSGGPIITLTIEGMDIGDTLRLPKGGGVVEVEATVESIFPINSLEIVAQGRVVAAEQEPIGSRRLRLKAALKVDGHTWICARAGGSTGDIISHQDEWRRGVFAHTSPIYIAVGNNWELFNPDTIQYMLTLIEGSISYVHRRAPSHQPGEVTYEHGEEDHLGYLERPFRQAEEALRIRLENAKRAEDK